MIRYDVFRAVNPDESYPNTLFNVSIRKLKYDLPLPPYVCDELIKALTQSEKFERVEKFCSPLGLQKVRSELLSLETANRSPAYAGCKVLEDITEPELVNGYVLDLIAVNESAVREILRLAIEEQVFTDEVDAWIINHGSFFRYCRGFEIARMFFYADAEEKDEVMTFVDSHSFTEKSGAIAERSGSKLRFRDMVTRAT